MMASLRQMKVISRAAMALLGKQLVTRKICPNLHNYTY